MRAQGRRGRRPVDVVADQVGSPTYVGDLVEALLEVADGVDPRVGAARGERRVTASRFEQAQGGVRAASAPIRSGCGRSAPTGIRVPPPAARTRRCRQPGCRRRPGSRPCGRGARRWPRRWAPTVPERSDSGVLPAGRYPLRRERRTIDRGDGDVFTGPHLDRFLASLSHATDRPVTVVMADNGSTDGAPEEALERHPNARLLRTGANLGYGTAVNRAVAEYLATRARATPSSSSWPTPTSRGVRAASTCCWRPRSGGRGPGRSAR